MKNKKFGLAAIAVGALGFLACLPFGQSGVNAEKSPLLNRDTTYLVVLDGTVKNLGEDGVKLSQEQYVNSIRRQLGFNFRVVETYDAINVMKIQANSSVKEILESGENATFVAVNKKYRFGETYNESLITPEERTEGYIPYINQNIEMEEGQGEDEDPLSNQSAITMNVPLENNGGAGSFVAILDSGFYLEHEAFSNLEGIGAEKARFHYDDLKAVKEQLKGKPDKDLGNVSDSFVNPVNGNDDGSCYYNLKVPYYYDYGGNDSIENNFDCYGYASEHGCHVASITAANGPYKGIAPNAQLALMKVFNESFPTEDNPNRSVGTGAGDEDITEALNDCLVLGVDAINMSLGSDLDDFRGESAGFAALSKLEKAGCSCNISAGNGGKGLYSFMNGYNHWSTSQVDTGVLGSYATTSDTNIIGSSTTPKQHYEKAFELTSVDGQSKQVVGYSDQVDYSGGQDGITKDNEKLLAETFKDNPNVEFVTAGEKDAEGHYYGQDADYEKVMEVKGNDYYKGKIAVCDRGNTTFVAKAQAAEAAGAAALVVINNDPTAYEFTFGMSWGSNGSYTIPKIPVVFVLYRDRDFILNKAMTDVLDPDTNKVIAHEGSGKIIADQDADNPDAYKMSDFSSEGASSFLEIIPTISTPGSSIKGAVQGKANGKGVFEKDKCDPQRYEYLNGTSMSCPNYTGIVALLIGERDFANEEERFEFCRSLTMRTMSTATQYNTTSTVYTEIEEIPNQYKESDLKHEDPITIYVPKEGTSIEEVAPYSPRKQGAGIVNAGKAINSSVYLEGLNSTQNGDFETKDDKYVGTNFAKIELKNNDLIKNGAIKLGFKVHNEGGKHTTYKAHMNVLTSQVTAYHNHDNELANYVGNDATLEGAKVQSANDHVLEKDVELGTFTLTGEATQDVVLNAHQISQASKDYLAQFENGMFLEGYVYLTPVGEEVSDENPELSMPYLGFYGDYASSAAVEPFYFEREEKYSRTDNVLDGHLYGSDLVNFVGKYSYSLSNIDTGSLIGGASFADYQEHDRKTNISTNSDNILGFTNSHPLVVEKDAEDNYTLRVGGEETDVLYVQNFVNRSIQSSSIVIKDRFNKIAVSTKFTDILRNTGYLFKSHITANYIGSRQLVHRAYSEIPLYDANGVKLVSGEYKLTFTYNLLYGSTQQKTYKLIIDGQKPKVQYRGIFDKNGTKYIRIKFNELYFDDKSRITVNAGVTQFELVKVTDGYFVDVVLDDAFVDGKLFINLIDASYNVTRFIMNEDSLEAGLAIVSNRLTPGSTYSYKTTDLEGGNINRRFDVYAKDYTGEELDLGVYEALVSFEKAINVNTLSVVGIDASGEETSRNIKVEVINESTIRVTGQYKSFIVRDSGKENDPMILVDTANVIFDEYSDLHGKVFVDKVSGAVGESVTVYVVPDDGYVISRVVVNGVELQANENGGYSFVLIAGENEVVVTYIKK